MVHPAERHAKAVALQQYQHLDNKGKLHRLPERGSRVCGNILAIFCNLQQFFLASGIFFILRHIPRHIRKALGIADCRLQHLNDGQVKLALFNIVVAVHIQRGQLLLANVHNLIETRPHQVIEIRNDMPRRLRRVVCVVHDVVINDFLQILGHARGNTFVHRAAFPILDALAHFRLLLFRDCKLVTLARHKIVHLGGDPACLVLQKQRRTALALCVAPHNQLVIVYVNRHVLQYVAHGERPLHGIGFILILHIAFHYQLCPLRIDLACRREKCVLKRFNPVVHFPSSICYINVRRRPPWDPYSPSGPETTLQPPFGHTSFHKIL